ncbi:MAG: LuxR C-terminal-related transcriptional regulator [Chloroflexaceae bacterium]|jgi:DNA-binding NarL/FixJ family response regulator|nr:LuxR C-terminal-related transcriptional regulator [Chloroflexaceae bacterium]
MKRKTGDEQHTSTVPALWLARKPHVYVPRNLVLQLWHTPRPTAATAEPASETLPHAFLAQAIRSRYVGRFHPQNLRFDDYQLLEIATAPLAPRRHVTLPLLSSTAQAEPLTAREVDMLKAAAAGLSNAEIASRFCLTVGTVKWHLSNIYGKLGVRRRTQALAKARTLGYLED